MDQKIKCLRTYPKNSLSLVNTKRFHACFTCYTIFCKPKSYAEHLKQCKRVINQSTSTDDIPILSTLIEFPQQPQFRCLKCKTLFPSEEVLLTHYTACLIYNCMECNKQFSSEGTLKIHLLTKHCKDNQSLPSKHEFTCESCSKECLDSLESIYAYFPKFKKIMCNYCKWSYYPSLLIDNAHVDTISSDSDTSVARSIPDPIDTDNDNMDLSADVPRQEKPMRISKTVMSIDLSQIQKNATPTSNALLKYESKIDELFEVISLKEFKTGKCCRVCENKSKNLISLKRHYIKSHSLYKIPPTHVCTCCLSKCTSFIQIGHHLYEKHVPFLKCEFCNFNFCSVKDRTRHIEESHYEICQFCTVIIKRSKEEMMEHLTWHLTEESVKCETCDEMFTGIRKLRDHKKNLKRKPKEIKGLCVNCGKVVNDLKRHIYRSHSKKKKKKMCLTCGKMLSMSVYQYHKNVLHTNFKNSSVQCPACGKMQKSYKHLNQHRRVVHEKHLYSQCPDCSKKFPFPYLLKKHLASCSGEIAKSFECDACGKVFKSKNTLIKHLRNEHGMEVRRFACRHCPNKFFRNDARMVHERIHTGERPYCCSVCGQRFRRFNDCRLHEKRHSGKNVPDLGYYVEYEKLPNDTK